MRREIVVWRDKKTVQTRSRLGGVCPYILKSCSYEKGISQHVETSLSAARIPSWRDGLIIPYESRIWVSSDEIIFTVYGSCGLFNLYMFKMTDELQATKVLLLNMSSQHN